MSFAARVVLAGLTVLGLSSLAGAAPPVDDGSECTFPIPGGNPAIAPDHVFVKFKANTAGAAINGANAAAGVLEVLFDYAPLVPDLYCVRVAPGTVAKGVAAYQADPSVQYAGVDYLRYACVQTTPYGITMVTAPSVWPTGGQGAGVKVAVLDTGVDLSHPDLPVPVQTISFINGETVDDFNSHGTHTSGTVLALNNTDGVVGCAPQASLMMGKVLGNGGSGSDAGVLAGVNWAVANGAKVVSMSLGGGGFSQAFQDGVTAAVSANVLVVAAAGNGNNADPFYPAWYTGVVSVAAIDSSMARASFSNFGPTVSVCAPGVNVQSTVPVIAGVATWNSVDHAAGMMSGSAIGSATAHAYYCSTGGVASDFPAIVAGNIAHIRRGGLDGGGNRFSFQIKVQNALDAGAIGVIISNDSPGAFTGTLNMGVNIPVVSITQADGDNLQANDGVITTESISITGHGYANFSGTSMSCPHVAGVAGLLIASFSPRAIPVSLLRESLENTATDLGDPGRDDLFGHGLINAVAARAYIASHLCGSADFNCDGDTGTDADIEAFFACIAGSCPAAPCNGTADFNADGDVGTDADIEAFFRVLGGGSC
jgi:subtilisin family serine protease